MTGFVVRPASRDEFAVAIDWAAGEGWNPGLGDLDAFHPTDPDGFLMGFEDGEPVSAISVVRYGDDFGFLGFYLVHPEHRGQGHGIATWQAGLAHLAGRTVGLDGVVDQQDNYRRSGFTYHGRNVRFTGLPEAPADGSSAVTVRPLRPDDLAPVAAMDRRVFPADRRDFLGRWTAASSAMQRNSVVAEQDGALTGFGTIRKCWRGWKIGPLVAPDPATARAVFDGLCHSVSTGEEVTLDVPEANPGAVALARSLGLEPVFETARMYLGPIPAIDEWIIYGITSFELG